MWFKAPSALSSYTIKTNLIGKYSNYGVTLFTSFDLSEYLIESFITLVVSLILKKYYTISTSYEFNPLASSLLRFKEFLIYRDAWARISPVYSRLVCTILRVIDYTKYHSILKNFNIKK